MSNLLKECKKHIYGDQSLWFLCVVCSIFLTPEDGAYRAEQKYSIKDKIIIKKSCVGNLSPTMGRGIDSRNRVWNGVAKLHRLAGRYDNPMPPWYLVPIAGLKLSRLCFLRELPQATQSYLFGIHINM